MYSLVRLLQPRWVRDRLKYMWCTHCSWRYPVDPQYAKYPTRELAQVIAAAWEAHDCGAYGKAIQ